MYTAMMSGDSASSISTLQRGYLPSRAGQVHYASVVKQSNTGRALFMLHQTASSGVMFHDVMHRLQSSQADISHVVAPDTPGFGGSSHITVEPPTVQGFAASLGDAVEAYLNKFQLNRACIMYGHHTGAAMAVKLATDFPGLVQGLILHGPPLLTTNEQREQVRGMYSNPELCEDGSHMTCIWDRIRAKDPAMPLELAQREAVLSMQAGTNYVGGYQAVANLDLEELLAKVSIPVLIIAGGRDSLKACVEPTAERLKHCECTIKWLAEDAGTFACDIHPDAVADVIAEWIQTIS